MKAREFRLSGMESVVKREIGSSFDADVKAVSDRIRLAYDARLNSLERVVKKYDGHVKAVKEENRKLKEEVRVLKVDLKKEEVERRERERKEREAARRGRAHQAKQDKDDAKLPPPAPNSGQAQRAEATKAVRKLEDDLKKFREVREKLAPSQQARSEATVLHDQLLLCDERRGAKRRCCMSSNDFSRHLAPRCMSSSPFVTRLTCRSRSKSALSACRFARR